MGDSFMIREFKEKDLDYIMNLWLITNLLAHSFIDTTYWTSNYDRVKEMLPEATIYVYEENAIVQGFIGVMDCHIAGIFVSWQSQSKGIGKKLLDYAKTKWERLSLCVYKENDRAVKFYQREHFKILKDQVEDDTGKIEYCMEWVKGVTL